MDEINNLNVLFFNLLYIEEGKDLTNTTIYKCAKLFYSNNNKIVIITSNLWEGDNNIAYYFAQILFPKLDIKFNLAMKQTKLNEKLYQENPSQFLDTKTCLPYKSWDEFIELESDDYGNGIKHNRTKIFNPISQQDILKLNEIRNELLNLGYLKKSTDILIITDTVNYGAASNFLKTIQNNGGAIIVGYLGNPPLNKSNIETLDASLDPAFSLPYENSDEYKNLKEKGFNNHQILIQ